VTVFGRWCKPAKVTAVGSHVISLLVSFDDGVGIESLAARLPSCYATSDALSLVARSLGKEGVAEFLQGKFPRSLPARSGDMGEILATVYLAEDCGYVVGPSRLIQRDHQEWAMRGDDVLGAAFGADERVLLAKGEAKSRARASARVVTEAREGLARNDELPSPHSLLQFAERLLATSDAELGEAVLKLMLDEGIRPDGVTHLMFLFVGNDPTSHVVADLDGYTGEVAQTAVILRAQAHQEFVCAAFEKAITDGA